MFISRFFQNFFITVLIFLNGSLLFADESIPVSINEPMETEFGRYEPIPISFQPNVESFSLKEDFSNVFGFDQYASQFGKRDSILLRKNHFTVKRSCYKQMFDIYNICTWDATPVFITTDAVLHIYHILFDQFLQKIETTRFVSAIENMTVEMLTEMRSLYEIAESEEAREALKKNIAFLSVGHQLITSEQIEIPAMVQSMVDSELVLIEEQKGFEFSPIFGPFSKLDYSQFKPRGHYTKTPELEAYFKTCMWYGKMTFTMVPALFGTLSQRHTLQALALVQALFNTPAFDDWETVYRPTVFFVGKTDDPNVIDYRDIAETVYGTDFFSLSPDSLANPLLLDQFMTEAQLLPEPKIPNWIYGTFITYKGFRFMGQRFIPDSYMFSRLVLPYVEDRLLPKGLDIMAILGSDRAFTLMDSVYQATSYRNYSTQIDSFKEEFLSKPEEEWVQNLYWNWLYTLMPLLYDKGTGYPYFMQTNAWKDKELMTALASWTELRHDAILYAKQSMTPCCIPPGPPQSYVEPNPHLYARLASLCKFTRDGLKNRELLLEGFAEKLNLFESLLHFLVNISIKELENQPITAHEYENMLCFGKVMQNLVSYYPNPEDPWEMDTDDMAIVADVHTDSNTDVCLEEGVGYPLEIFVIVNNGGSIRLARGAVFSYYEFSWPISDRLTDEKWREILTGESPPDMPIWFTSFMDPDAAQPDYQTGSPNNLFDKDFSGMYKQEPVHISDHIYLYQNYPNPFNPETKIRFELPDNMDIDLVVYDIMGRKIRTLFSGSSGAGIHEYEWNGTDQNGVPVSSGIYFYKLETEVFIKVKKMFLLR